MAEIISWVTGREGLHLHLLRGEETKQRRRRNGFPDRQFPLLNVDLLEDGSEGGVSPIVMTADTETERAKFERLRNAWLLSLGPTSLVEEMAMDMNYQYIIGMGESAIPFLIEELRTRPDHWFWALCAITEENPVSPEDAGIVDRMVDAWIHWAERNPAKCRAG